MNAPDWTPGPWDVRGVDGEDDLIDYEIDAIGEQRWTAMATVYGNEDAELDAQSVGNARLIAAAPDLYEALREAVEDYGARMPAGWMNEARAALAKARGEETK